MVFYSKIEGVYARDIKTMVERVGFEPTIPVTRNNRFRGGRFRPLSHLSKKIKKKIK